MATVKRRDEKVIDKKKFVHLIAEIPVTYFFILVASILLARRATLKMRLILMTLNMITYGGQFLLQTGRKRLTEKSCA
ncbi:uncharacterized protein PHALS_15341 [Plasmopara halstedii]|uniref:Uncharacterized protein n=1 Tax=Plasmopara halstedii TaxID=4781 RepID=A0A0N7L4J4_PLAHL|nr:uncharacterized protein PHALS_15341 [Plasmopara halstedii]CEG38843.1 hypothetical protein PHALS_15341 [Plasmopara halstedii]|eukprot:XP_024575212.1 hypothetical protein PHALS_15341 [Plasmopara halstedii]